MGSELKVHMARAFFTAFFAFLGETLAVIAFLTFFTAFFAFLRDFLGAIAFLAFFKTAFAAFLVGSLATRAFLPAAFSLGTILPSLQYSKYERTE